nr:hypothetical protein BaRGS_013855 [Batillaria attramentaria]
MGSVFDIDAMVVMGVTDVDDKIIKRMKETGAGITHLTRTYEIEFFQDMISLNVSAPTALTRVTDHMQHIIDFVQGSVYFDVLKYGRYGIMKQVSYDPEKASHLFLKEDKEKMSKSLKNTVSVNQMLESYTPNQFRMLCLLTHYRNYFTSRERLLKKPSLMTSTLLAPWSLSLD